MKGVITRRAILWTAAVAPAVAVVGGAAAAEPPNTKPEVKFQFTPKGSDKCGDCVSFIPGETSGGPGTCKAVQGTIPQNGWCVLFARRKL